jgi:hypothetical protein
LNGWTAQAAFPVRELREITGSGDTARPERLREILRFGAAGRARTPDPWDVKRT